MEKIKKELTKTQKDQVGNGTIIRVFDDGSVYFARNFTVGGGWGSDHRVNHFRKHITRRGREISYEVSCGPYEDYAAHNATLNRR